MTVFDPVKAVAEAKRELEATPRWMLCAELQARLALLDEARRELESIPSWQLTESVRRHRDAVRPKPRPQHLKLVHSVREVEP